MLELENFLAELAAQDIKLWVDGGKLRCNAPQGAMTSQLQARISEHKAELLEFLSRCAVGGVDQDIPLCSRQERIPLTQGQERIWSLAKLDPESSVYNVPTVFRLSGALSRDALEAALTEIAERHEILRTLFPGESLDDACQQILPAAPLVLPVVPIGRDLRKLPPNQVKRTVRGLLEGEIRKPFNLQTGPLWRVRLFQLAPQEHLLAFAMHHIVFDGLSKAIFLDELGKTYAAKLAGRTSDLPPLKVQFADVAVWQRKRLDAETAKRQLAYWEERLGGNPPPLLVPNDQARPAKKGRAGSVHFSFPPGLLEKLSGFCRQEQASMFIVLMSAFAVLLNRYSGQEDLLVCAPMASREHADIEKLLGYFNNIVVIRSDLSGNPSFRDLLNQVKRLSVEAYDNQFVPLQSLAQLPHLLRVPLTRAMLSFQEGSSGHLAIDGVKAKPVSVRKDAADFDLAVYIERDAESLGGVLDYNADIFSANRIKRLLQRFGMLLNQLLTNPLARLDANPVFGKQAEHVALLLNKHPQIEAATVVQEGRTGNLNAYLVLNEHDVPSLAAIRQYAQKALPDFRVPAAFIPLDEFPLDAEGNVDLKALPPPGNDRDRLPTSYAAPRTPLEEALCKIWKEVLWLDFDVGVLDRFRDLGGHSLLSVQLVSEIERQLGRSVPAKALAALNTVEELAAALEGTDDAGSASDASAGPRKGLPGDIYHGLRSHTASWEGKRASADSVMVGLNTEGKRQPLFWCLQRYQELTQLAKYLGQDQPVYGMRSGNRVMVKTQDNIDLLASYYVEEILEVDPDGPFLIGGNCQAAQIAFQIASQLSARGYEITLLILQEKFIPFPYAGPVAMLFGDKSHYNPRRYFKQPEIGWRKFYSGPMVRTIVPGAHGQFFREPNVQVLVGTIAKHIEAAQAGVFGDPSLAGGKTDLQRLPEDAYRVRLANQQELANVAPGTKSELAVSISNISACDWMPWGVSGLALAGRWINEAGNVTMPIDGAAILEDVLTSGSTVTMKLPVQAPEAAGRWILQVDMVEDGVAWFQDKGAVPLNLAVLIQ